MSRLLELFEEHHEQRCIPQTSSELSEPYFAFWTDFAHNIEPQPLFTVNAGDDLKASLAFTRGRCTLTIADTTTGAHARFSISVPGDAAINQAGWTQEDITDSAQEGRSKRAWSERASDPGLNPPLLCWVRRPSPPLSRGLAPRLKGACRSPLRLQQR